MLRIIVLRPLATRRFRCIASVVVHAQLLEHTPLFFVGTHRRPQRKHLQCVCVRTLKCVRVSACWELLAYRLQLAGVDETY